MAKKSKQQIEHEAKVYEISTLVAGDFSLQEALDKLAAAAAKTTKASACSIRLLDDETSDLKMRATYNISEEYRNKGPVMKDDPVIQEAFEGKAVIIDDASDDSRIKYREATLKEGLMSQLTVAMVFRNRPLGVLRLYSSKARGFTEDDVALARMVASQCAVAITNAKLYSQALEGARMAEQLRLGAVIQRRMIPHRPPQIPGLDIAAIYQPCFQIGGDLYDFMQINDHTLVVAIADVIGKGIPAAIMMSMFRGTMRAYADGGYDRHSMSDILQELNRVAFRECRNGEFITLFIATIDVQAMTITYCSCGHEPGVLIRQGKMIELDQGGLVLGVLENVEYPIEQLPLEKGDTLMLYTDGLIDATNFDSQMWGKDEMARVLLKNANESAESIIHNLLAYRRRFVGLAPQIDDTSVVTIRVHPDTQQTKQHE